MEALQIRNVRSLTDTGRIRLAPITLLLGQNSSGKSTFVRFFPLLKQGAEARTREPLLWLGRLVDFGSTEEAFSRFATQSRMGFSLELSVPSGLLEGRRRQPTLGSVTSLELVKVSVDYAVQDRRTIESYEYVLEFRGHRIEVAISTLGRILSLHIDRSDLTEIATNSPIASSWFGPVPAFESIDADSLTGKSAYAELFKFVRVHMDGRTGPHRSAQLTRALTGGGIDGVMERALVSSAGDEYWRRQVRNWLPGTQKAKRLTELVLAYQFFTDLSSAVALQIRRTLNSIKYITPLRASAERYYRLQGLSIEEIDPQGQNVAMFLHNLSNTDKANFAQWMSRFFGVQVATQSSQGHVSLYLRSPEEGQIGYNLADTGFGYSQMLPILVQLWSIASRKRGIGSPIIFAIEQPELHLHPKLQARLADVFLAAITEARRNGVDLRLIVETHSEQIVSALGLNIGRGEASVDDVSVVLFEKDELHKPSFVRTSQFGPDGVLQSWPYGFFEAKV